jgi:hypothetical protein
MKLTATEELCVSLLLHFYEKVKYDCTSCMLYNFLYKENRLDSKKEKN